MIDNISSSQVVENQAIKPSSARPFQTRPARVPLMAVVSPGVLLASKSRACLTGCGIDGE
jgi:hypothetical protein